VYKSARGKAKCVRKKVVMVVGCAAFVGGEERRILGRKEAKLLCWRFGRVHQGGCLVGTYVRKHVILSSLAHHANRMNVSRLYSLTFYSCFLKVDQVFYARGQAADPNGIVVVHFSLNG
jgi:hypothetical protein